MQHDNLAPMYNCGAYYGCTIGRYANRIAKGEFTIDGRGYHLAVNNGKNHLHGGLEGFDKKIWSYTFVEGLGIEFSYRSKDMEEGYPGNLQVRAKYVLNAKNEFIWSMEAETDKKTIVNLTNHTYWNLSGDIHHNDIRGHVKMSRRS